MTKKYDMIPKNILHDTKTYFINEVLPLYMRQPKLPDIGIELYAQGRKLSSIRFGHCICTASFYVVCGAHKHECIPS
jgi:hypothetical protein